MSKLVLALLCLSLLVGVGLTSPTSVSAQEGWARIAIAGDASLVALSVPQGAGVNLTLDDGSPENSIGLTAGGEFLWFNQFTPDPADYPFTLTEVQVLFGADTNCAVGDVIDLYVWTDPDADPANGAAFVAAATGQTIQVIDAFSSYAVDIPLNGPGDVLIGVVNRGCDAGGQFPATMDSTASQQRSWVAFGEAPGNPPTLPAPSQSLIDTYGFPGNWMIRGVGVVTPVGAEVELTADQAVACTNEDSVTLTATAEGAAGELIEGEDVTFEVVTGPHAGLTIIDTTDANGEATYTYIGTTAGTDSVEASYTNSLGATVTSAPVDIVWQECARTITLSADQTEARIDEESVTLLATVESSVGDPVSGVEVTFEIVTGPHAGMTGTDTTDADGEATFTYAGSSVGTDRIVARFTDEETATVTSDPVEIVWVDATPYDLWLPVAVTRYDQ